MPLRLRVILLVTIFNVAVFGGGLVWFTRRLSTARQNSQTLSEELVVERLRGLIDSLVGERVAGEVIRWEHWARYEDALVVQLREFEPGWGLDPDVSGLFLNPLGSGHRPPLWDQDQILADIRLAATEQRSIQNERGLSVPLRLISGKLWGGVWLKPRRDDVALDLLRELSPWFLLTTVLLTLSTLIGMRSLVLEPVRRLARGAMRLSSGDLTARVQGSSRNDELSDLVRSFNAMASEVQGFNARLAHEVEVATEAVREAEAAIMTQRRLAATGELAAGIAHEINNPLGGMLNALEVLQRSEVPAAKRAQYHRLLQGGLERIRQTVGQVLRLAPRETRIEPVIMADPLGDALGLVRHRAAQQETSLVLDGLGGRREFGGTDSLEPWRALPSVRGQQNELGQAVLNLLVNSLDALESGGTVTLGLERAGGALHLWVVDDGPGMDAELIGRAADPFFTTKDTGKGTGLGLAIVHNVVSGHAGRVRFSSPPGGGFRVDVELPLESQADSGGAAGGAAGDGS
ncbi:MAG: HAMP domain-containing sensor histidine kinase [Planctomycetota bacterium]